MRSPLQTGIPLVLVRVTCTSRDVPPERDVPVEPAPVRGRKAPPPLRKPDMEIFDIIDARGTIRACFLHGEEMPEDIVLVAGGLPDTRWEDPQTFPYANTELWIGSCVVGPELLARVRFCPTCRERKAAYLDDLVQRKR